MSEILIKGMALPKPSTYPITLSIYPNGNIYIHHELSAYKAIEVPPHGRLIDADFFKEYAIRVSTEDGREYIPSNYVDIVPTILEASK